MTTSTSTPAVRDAERGSFPRVGGDTQAPGASAYERRRRTYERLPALLRAPVGWVPFRWVAGPRYVRAVATRRWLEHADRTAVLAWRARALGRILRWAASRVPAYAHLRGRVQSLPAERALEHFPLLTKEDIQADPERYLARSRKEIAHYRTTTGGTSGNQLDVLLDEGSQALEIGFMHRQWARVGYHPGCRKITLRGVEFPRAERGRLWQRNPVYNELQLSPFHLSGSRLDAYWHEARRFRPRFLHGYPSAVALFARLLEEAGLDGARLGLRAVLLGSEGVLPGQRETIERVFRARAYSWYGHSERTILGGECECSPAYHLMPDYGHAELVGEHGGACEEPGTRGEIVGTGFWNRTMPLIRYRSGDRARRLDWRCACGRAHDRIDEVEGRWAQEMVVGRSGALISVAALNLHGALFDEVLRYQYVQERPGVVVLRLMASDRFDEDDAARIVHAYRRKVGGEVSFTVQVVDDIPLTPRGKLRRLVQHVDISA